MKILDIEKKGFFPTDLFHYAIYRRSKTLKIRDYTAFKEGIYSDDLEAIAHLLGDYWLKEPQSRKEKFDDYFLVDCYGNVLFEIMRGGEYKWSKRQSV